MADDYDNEMDDGRLMIATDDEHMDYSAGTPTGEGPIEAAIAESSTSFPDNEPTKNILQSRDKISSIEPSIQFPVDSSTGQDTTIPDSTQGGANTIKTEECGMEDGELEDDEDENDNGGKTAIVGLKIEEPSTTVDIKPLMAIRVEQPPGNGKRPMDEQQPNWEQARAGTGIHNFLKGGNTIGAEKLPQQNKVDKSTCVFTKPNGMSSLDEHLLSMRPGSTCTIDITIICKAGGNTLYICAKWKGRDYHGVLTDGEPLYSHLCAQKRTHLADKLGGGNGHTGGATDKNDLSTVADRNHSGSTPGKQRGGKRGVGLPKNSTTTNGEKRAKSSSALLEDESEETSNGKQKQPNMNHNSSSSSLNVGTTATTIGNAPRPSLASPTTTTTSVHLHPHHHHVGIARRRLSSASSTHSHHHHSHGLQEVDDRNTFIYTRCPHRQCGYRFETISDMNTHLLIGHKTAETKAKIFESIATQTLPAPETVSTSCDPCFSPEQPTTLPPSQFCAKCKQQMTMTTPSEEVEIPRPAALLKVDGKSPKKQRKLPKDEQVGEKPLDGQDNSPGFSDISDDAAPTLEKEETFDKPSADGNDEQRSGNILNEKQQTVTPTTIEASSSTELIGFGPIAGTTVFLEEQNSGLDNSVAAGDREETIKCQSPTRQPKKTSTDKKLHSSEELRSGATTIDEQQAQKASLIGIAGSPNTTGFPYALSGTAGATAAAIFGAYPHPFMSSFPPQLQAFVQQQQHVAAAAPTLSLSQPQPMVNKFMSPPPPPGLLSLGTPLVSAASSSGSITGTHQSKNAIAAAADGPPPHKIYELAMAGVGGASQSRSSNHFGSRSSSTKPPSSAQLNNSISPQPNMRPNSAVPRATGQQQQRVSIGLPPFTPAQQQQFMFHPSTSLFGIVPGVGPPLYANAAANFSPPIAPPSSLSSTTTNTAFNSAAHHVQQQQQIRRNNNDHQLQYQQQLSNLQTAAVPFGAPPTGIMPPPPPGMQASLLAAANAMDNMNVLQQFAALLGVSAASAFPPHQATATSSTPTGQQQQPQQHK